MRASPLSVHSPPPPGPSLRPRAPTLLGLALAAAAGHWLLLGDWLLGARGAPPASPSPGLTLIQLRPASPAAPPAPAPPPDNVARQPDAPPRPAPRPLPESPALAETRTAAVAEDAAGDAAPAASEPTPPQPEAAETPEAQPASTAGSAEADPPPSTGEGAMALPGVQSDVPVYRVALPPGFVTAYEFRRGALAGTAEISWAPAGGRYEMRLQAKIGEVAVLTQTSEGRFETTGLEPERFVDKRVGRNAQAVNFQSDKGVITFSGPDHRYAWRVGTQDRLSWLVQLPAILAAEALRLEEGQRLAMVVVGARGDADVWTFRILGWDEVATAGGAVRGLKLLREARQPHDQQVEVWLDPQRHYLPVRARIGGPGDAKPFELLRQ